MKMTTLLFLVLSLATFAVAADPVTATVDKANHQVVFTNTSGRDVMAFEAEWTEAATDTMPMSTVKHRHDFFTQAYLFSPGMAMPLSDYYSQPVVKWVQFADGTTWGDAAAGQYLLDMRNEGYKTLVLLNSMTDADFLTELKKPAPTSAIRPDVALRGILLDKVNDESLASARQAVIDRLGNANKNKASGKF